MLFPMLTPMLMPMLILGIVPTMALAMVTMAGIGDTMERDLLMLSQMPSLQLMLMPMLMPGTVPMAMAMVMVVDIEDMVDTMAMALVIEDMVDTDTGERRRGLLMPPLKPMPMLTLTTS